MSSTTVAEPVGNSPGNQLWSLWSRQVAAILRLEIRKNFLGKRALLIYLLTLMPVFILSMLVMIPFTAKKLSNAINANMIFAGLFEGFILRTVVFFGCAWIFMNLFRGEIVDKSLHYYFLAPVRREVLV